MRRFIAGCVLLSLSSTLLANSPRHHKPVRHVERSSHVQLGQRPFFLVDDMTDSPLKRELQQCARRGHFTARDFSIGHRGAAMQFPEHTMESYVAAARMGAVMLGWRGYKVGKLLKSWKAQAPSDVSATADVAG